MNILTQKSNSMVYIVNKYGFSSFHQEKDRLAKCGTVSADTGSQNGLESELEINARW